jgi:leucyl aminopeptidase
MQLPELQLLPGEQLSTSQLCNYDGTIIVFHDPESLAQLKVAKTLGSSITLLSEFLKLDQSAGRKEVNVIINSAVPGGKLIIAPTGQLLRDQDDVRRYAEATRRAISRAKATGSIKRPLLVLQPPPLERMEEPVRAEFSRYYEVATLAALAEMHEPLEARESLPELKDKKFQALHVVLAEETAIESVAEKIAFLQAIEIGRRLARDIGGADPERMTSIRAAEAVKSFMSEFNNISVSIIDDMEILKREYPLLAAVARASEHGNFNRSSQSILIFLVPRHAPRVVHLEYRSPDQSQVIEDLYIVGKGINYDTGGADVKTGGNMVGMSRDKCGAAAMAGLVATCALLKPKHINLTVDLAFVRNSIGSNAYVSDEVIKSRAGQRVRIGNTDAEGRMVMADLLAHMRERALAADPSRARLFTCATLTGHVARAYGPYSAAMENGPAKLLKIGDRIKSNGQLIGDCFELSTLRREDYDFVQPLSNCEDVLQANRHPSSVTPRGHQYPAAFLSIASGLSKHGLDAPKGQRLAYTHLDIAGAAEEGPGPLSRPTSTPIAALTTTFLKN